MIPTIARALVVVAALSRAAPPQAAGADTARLENAEALGHYVVGRMLEEQGDSDGAFREYYRALSTDPHAPGIARRISELAARTGDPQRSLEFATRALAADSTDARALWLEGAAQFQLGHVPEALSSLQAATAADSESAEYFESLAHVAEEANLPDVQERALKRLVTLRDDDSEAWFQLAALAARRDQFDEAAAALAQAADINPDRPGMDFLRGWIAEGQGRDSLAIESYRRHLAAHDSDQMTRRRLVTLLARQERFPEAYREARQVAQSSPGDADALLVEAELAFSSGAPQAGRELLARLERDHPDDPQIFGRMVAVLARAGKTHDAVTLATRWAAAHPGNYRGELLEARALLLAKQNPPALEHARTAVSLAPDSVETHALLGSAYQAAERWAEAESVWSAAYRKFPTDSRLPLQLSYCREKLGDLAGAERPLRELLQREPDNAEALNSLGYLMADHSKNLTEAEKMIRRAVDQDPQNGAFIDSLGWVYYRLGRLNEARIQLERAVELTNGDAIVCEHLGDVYKDLKLNDLARKLYRRSLEKDSTNTRVRAKLEQE
jgi:tetratricopeptide (TPR) repeat protein